LTYTPTSTIVIDGNAGIIAYVAGSGQKIQVIHTPPGGSAVAFPINIIADSTSRNIDFSEILRALPLQTPSIPSGSTLTEKSATSAVKVQLLNSDDSVAAEINRNAFRGFYKDKATGNDAAIAALLTRILTQAPQIRKTYPDSREYLSILINTTTAGDYVRATARVYFTDGSNELVTLHNELSPGGTNRIITLRTDFDRISSSLLDPSDAAQVQAWDISISLAGTIAKTFPPIRYEFVNGRVREACFAFLNEVGGIDTIHSVGSFKRLAEFEPQDFINGGMEYAIATNSNTSYEIESGPIQSDAEKRLWMAFLRSKDKRYIRKTGSTVEIIPIVMKESTPVFNRGELDSVSFKFHLDYERGAELDGMSNELPEYNMAAIRFEILQETGTLVIARNSANTEPQFALNSATGCITAETSDKYAGPVFSLDIETGQIVMISQ